MAQDDGVISGWLYIIRLNKLGLKYLRKRYFILDDHCLKSFKSLPTSDNEEPLRSSIIDSCICITNDGRKAHRRKAVFGFTLYNTCDHSDQLKLGATSPEEASRWICSLQKVALKPGHITEVLSKSKWQPFRLNVSNGDAQKNSIDWNSASSMHVEAVADDDVISPSPWKIFGCQNGLRLFIEAKDRYSNAKRRDNHPAMMSAGIIKGTSEAIFRTLMSLGPSRSEWDFCFCRGSVVEQLDDYTDIIHVQLCNHWLPWGVKRRDLVLRRYWRRENDGHYVILYHSVIHKKCPPKDGYTRACLKSGGYVVIPINQGKECVVKHMLAIDWKSYLTRASERSITIKALGRIAALADLFKEKEGTYYSYEFSFGKMTRDVRFPLCGKEQIETEVICEMAGVEGKGTGDIYHSVSSSLRLDTGDIYHSVTSSLRLENRDIYHSVFSSLRLDDVANEFHDIPKSSDGDHSDQEGFFNGSPEMKYLDTYQQKLTSAANIVKKLHVLPDTAREDREPSYYGGTLPKDSTQYLPCSWAVGDPSLFLIRGEKYMEDSQKVKANGTLTQLVGADWLRSHKREDDLGSRPGGIVQRYASKGGEEFFFIINMQIPGSSAYNLAFYFMLKTPLKETPLLERFVNEDDTFRNSKFKLIPHVSKGPWIVKQSVGNKGCLLGRILKARYILGKNYFEVDIDVGTSMMARNVATLVLGYMNNVITEIAFVIQADNEEELPEVLLGTCRLNGLDLSKAVSVDTISSSS